MPQVLPGLWEGEIKGDAGAKIVHDSSSPESPAHSLEAKWRGGDTRGELVVGIVRSCTIMLKSQSCSFLLLF